MSGVYRLGSAEHITASIMVSLSKVVQVLQGIGAVQAELGMERLRRSIPDFL